MHVSSRAALALLALALLTVGSNRSARGDTITLSGTTYTQNFDGIGSGLPSGFTVRTGATLTSLGTAETFNTTKFSWAETSGAFKNLASATATALSVTATSTAQNNATNRALGIRQTSTFGDPGAAFVASFANSSGFNLTGVSVELQLLSDQTRSTRWTIDYRVGNTGSFTALSTFNDPGTFGSTTRTIDLSGFANLQNQSSNIDFRVVALTTSTGTGNRDTFGIDNFSLKFAPVAPPAAPLPGIAAAGAALMGCVAAWRRPSRGQVS